MPRLKTSTLIQRRDQTMSEDLIYVRHDGSGDWIALLGVDTLSGCFLYWDEQASLFQDVSCLGARYTPDGRYLDGLQSGEQPQNMARLPVDVRDDQVFVRDEIVRERSNCGSLERIAKPDLATRSGIISGVMGMTGFDRGGRRRLQAEPPSLVKGATALTANTNKLAQRSNMLAMAA